MKNYILNIGKGMIFAGAISLASCTGWFDNVPPYEATEDILEGDNVKVGAFFPQLQRNVVSTHNNGGQTFALPIYAGQMPPHRMNRLTRSRSPLKRSVRRIWPAGITWSGRSWKIAVRSRLSAPISKLRKA